jgi:hypothetical protein
MSNPPACLPTDVFHLDRRDLDENGQPESLFLGFRSSYPPFGGEALTFHLVLIFGDVSQ